MSDKITVTVDGVRTCIRALQLVNTETKARCQSAVKESLDEAVAQAEARVPRRTEELAHTIRGQILGNGLVGLLEAGFGTLKRRLKGRNKRTQEAYWLRRYRSKMQQGPQPPGIYAMVVEFGDHARNKPAEPYIVPAVEATRPHHIARMQAALQGAAAAAEQSA